MTQIIATETRRLALAAPGERLDRALAAACPDLSRSRLKALIEEGRVRVAGAVVRDPAKKLSGAAEIVIELPAPIAATPQGEALPLDILYEDAHLVVIDKPAGLVVHPGAGNPAGTLVNALIAHCGESLSGIGGVARPGIVHRLDKDTSGLLVAAKSDAVHRALAKAFETRTIERRYVAFVRGEPEKAEDEIAGAIGRSEKNRQKMAVTRRGKPALTRYHVLARYGFAAKLECRLATGRTHQIRVHLAHIGHAVIGDPLYGRGRAWKTPPGPARAALESFPRQALHAAALGFIHPVTGERLFFERDIPADMAALEATLIAAAAGAPI